MYLPNLEQISIQWWIIFLDSGNSAMQPKLKPHTVAGWNGPNQETEASSYFLHFVLFLNKWILQV